MGGAHRRRARIAILLLATVLTGPAHATSHHARGPSCTAIRKAVWSGRTLEQVTTEYDTDVAQAMKCLQTKGHRRKDHAPRKTRPAHQTKKPPPAPASRTVHAHTAP